MLCVLLLVCHLVVTARSELLSRHRRNWIIDSFSIDEENNGPFPYKLGTIELERDYLVSFHLVGQGLKEEPKDVLKVEESTGTVWVHKSVDYETYPVLMLHFEAKKSDSSLDTKLGVEITINDINDNAPSFRRTHYDVNVREDRPQGQSLLTVLAEDKDKKGTDNSKFSYRVKSVTPEIPDFELIIDQTGVISFKGCLDHEAAKTIVAVIEAVDEGEGRLSNTTTAYFHIEDSNDNQPIITGQTGSLKVKEASNGSVLVRLHVKDLDTKNSPAWRAKFTLHGDEDGYFSIETDPVTNDGIVTVVKPLDYEVDKLKNLSITVENELPYFACKVTEKTPSGPWGVENVKGTDPGAPPPHTVELTIEVEDVNEPPNFDVKVLKGSVSENSAPGVWIQNVLAVDKDSSFASEFEYIMGDDPAGWMTVDRITGNVTTVNQVDRESTYVKNGIYTVLVYAVDKGDPPLTGTATLHVRVGDINDNLPHPVVYDLDVCLSESAAPTNITAEDPDETPYGGPFTFELLGDVKRKWSLNPSYGYTAGLQKGPDVFAGSTTINVKITDMQGHSGVYNLSVVVCDCKLTPNCRSRRIVSPTAGFGALGIIFACLLLFLIVLLMAFACSNERQFTEFTDAIPTAQTLLGSNTEIPGTDCKVHRSTMNHTNTNSKRLSKTSYMSDLYDGIQITGRSFKELKHSQMNGHFDSKLGHMAGTLTRLHNGTSTQHQYQQSQNQQGHYQQNQNQYQNEQYQTLHKYSQHKYNTLQATGTKTYSKNLNRSISLNETLPTLIHLKLAVLQKTEVDFPNDWLHHYADEGHLDGLTQVDEIVNRNDDDDRFFQSTLQDLGPKFNKLGSICKPEAQ